MLSKELLQIHLSTITRFARKIRSKSTSGRLTIETLFRRRRLWAFSMDRIDLHLLALLQRDASCSVAELAERVHLSTGPCWRRIEKLEHDGVIQKRVALLNPSKLNVPVTAFVMLSTARHDERWFDQFAKVISQIPEVVDFYRMSGDVDYLLRLVVPHISAYDVVYKRLISVSRLTDISASFSLECLKSTTELPLGSVIVSGTSVGLMGAGVQSIVAGWPWVSAARQ
jgi:Lrp/AsnC family transcriptional regulator